MATLAELIRHDQPISTGATAVYPYSPVMERKYRFVSRYDEEVLLHEVDKENGLIHLPRALCPVGEQDLRDPGEPVVFPKKPAPRDHQVKMFGQVEDMINAELSGVVVAPTGFGKTLLGYLAAYTAGVKTLVITTKDDIYKQWLDGAQKFLGLSPDEIGEIRGDKCEVVGTKFCVAMIHSLSRDGKYPDWITKGFGLVIIDECHRMPADQFSTVATMFPAKIRMGLSATPDRSDGKEQMLYAHVGPIRAKAEAQMMVPKVLRFPSAWECPKVIREDKHTGERRVVRLPHQAGKTTHIEKILAADPVRNHLIAELIAAAHAKGRKVVVFSTLIDHLQSLHRAVHSAHGISGRDMGFYSQASTKAEKEARERGKVKPIIFTTYSMMSEGTDIPWLDTCILAIPRSNVIQVVGRIRREYPDKKQPVVMDVVDADSPVFANYAANRRKWYLSIGAEVVDM